MVHGLVLSSATLLLGGRKHPPSRQGNCRPLCVRNCTQIGELSVTLSQKPPASRGTLGHFVLETHTNRATLGQNYTLVYWPYSKCLYAGHFNFWLSLLLRPKLNVRAYFQSQYCLTLFAKVITMQLTCFPKVVQQQYVGQASKGITVVLQINCGPNVTEIG